ncbi:hypothetical protein CROQUDRAFT_101316 [Cronartium quercuum f. sp. fusiforme G11]|uniref:Uncharacterized protein n=1 Tax=Cronartium quercuum f. sp. fusiforme G11 TaxID=708437 RepID=A0A9P6T5J4_9BASI|nr:hypothetical protein CROQUDRAFT_101316 [Cronartium quercuum f. sp. fusiforme G11]
MDGKFHFQSQSNSHSQSGSNSPTHPHSHPQSHSTSDDSTDDHSVIDTPKPLPNSQNNQLSQSSLSKDNLVAFNKYAQQLGLDPAHQTMALQTAEAAGSVDQFIHHQENCIA